MIRRVGKSKPLVNSTQGKIQRENISEYFSKVFLTKFLSF